MKRLVKIIISTTIVVLLIAAIVLFWCYRAVHAVPEPYLLVLEMPEIERAEASDRMLQNVSTMVSDAKKPGEWDVAFTQDEINGWLAVDLVENHAKSLPESVEDPRVIIRPNEAMLLFKCHDERFDGVVSVQVDLFIAEPNVVALRIIGIRLGDLAIPRKYLMDQLSDSLQQAEFTVRWQQTDGDPVALIEIDPEINGDRNVQITGAQLDDQKLLLTGTTELIEDENRVAPSPN